MMRAQGSFSAIFSIVFTIGVIFFGILHIARTAEALGSSSLNDAIVISNDLLSNPGHNGTSLDWTREPVHIGLARYSTTKRSVEDHVLSVEKMDAVSQMAAGEIGAKWGLGKGFELDVRSLDGKTYLNKSSLPQDASFIEIRRLALVEKEGGYEPVVLSFKLQE